MPWLELATYYLIAINFVAFAAFRWDKAQAQRGGWRVRESTLVMLSSVGGLLGALAGRAAFRHKTRKPGFLGRMISGALVPPIVAAALWYFAPAQLTQSPEKRASAQRVMAPSPTKAATRPAPSAGLRCITATRAIAPTWTATAMAWPANPSTEPRQTPFLQKEGGARRASGGRVRMTSEILQPRPPSEQSPPGTFPSPNR